MFLANLGYFAVCHIPSPNYEPERTDNDTLKAFNKQKFFPRISAVAFSALAACDNKTLTLFEYVEDAIYSGTNPVMGYPDNDNETFSNYYLGAERLTRDQVSGIQKVMEARSVYSDNTRLKRVDEKDGSATYAILVASEEAGSEEPMKLPAEQVISSLQVSSLQVIKGDHSDSMRRINENLEKAKQFAANDVEKQMLDKHQQGFRTGDMVTQKEAQICWVQDKSPQVESLLGFIEYYRDPHGVRAEWRGFVLLENQLQTELFANLTQHSQLLLDLLPWNRNGWHGLDREKYEMPKFTSMEGKSSLSNFRALLTITSTYLRQHEHTSWHECAWCKRIAHRPKTLADLYSILISESPMGIRISPSEIAS